MPSGWEMPAPGEVWTTPGGSAPPAPPPPPLEAYPPPPSAPPVVREGQHLGTMSILLSVLLALAGLASVAVASAFSERADAVGEARSMTEVELFNFVPELVDLDNRLAAASAVYLLLFVLAGIAWLVWQRRFVRNSAPFAPIAPSLGWGTWGWLVPFAGLYLPQSQLANAARVTDPIRVRSELSGAAPPILYCWWVAFSGSTIVQVGSNFTRPGTLDPLQPAVSLRSFQKADEFAAMSSWLTAIAAVLGLATVLVCTARQRKMLAALDVRV
jgi:Domain of unknown function (DUF4328)